MQMHPLNDIGTAALVVLDRSAAVRRMTAEQLRHLGTDQVAYLKSGICDGEMRFVLYGANGQPFAVADDVDAAVDTAAAQGLNFIAVH
jgi:hypothetical protein